MCNICVELPALVAFAVHNSPVLKAKAITVFLWLRNLGVIG